MKLIIKIPDEVYKTVLDGSYCGSLYEELLDAIPYNPTGDWEVVHTATGETKCKCNQCQHYIKIGDDKNFCPNCGQTKMKGGAEE